MEWEDVRVLLAATRSRQLNEAAAKLGVDRSTVSRRIATLERAVGSQLFIRTREGIRPTAAAERLRPYAEQMEATAGELINASRAFSTRVRGVVRVATTDGFARWLVEAGLLKLREAHPELELELMADHSTVDLEKGEADLALRVAPLRSSALRVRCVGRTPLSLFASGHYLERRGRSRSPAALRGHDVLLPSGPLRALPESRWLQARHDVRVALRSSSMAALIAAALQGFGIVALPLAWGHGHGLEPLFELDGVPRRAIWLATAAEVPPGSAVGVVRDAIAGMFRQAPLAR